MQGFLHNVFSAVMRLLRLVKLAWRNLWRNKRRSLIMLGAIVVGLWGLIMVYGADNGMAMGMVNITVMSHTAHVQVHAPGYFENPELELTIERPQDILEKARSADHVQDAAPRLKARSMIMIARGSAGVNLVGIDPKQEARVSTLEDSIIRGRYLKPDDENKILVGGSLAEKLNLDLDKKLVIYTRDRKKELKALGFRIAGIYETGTQKVDKFMAFVPLDTLQEGLLLDGKVHEIAVRIDEHQNLDIASASVSDKLAGEGLEVLNWKQMYPFLDQMVNLMVISNIVMLVCVGIAMAFGIANTMIMAVFERFYELGIMKAIGTRPRQIFLIIILESVFLAITGLVIGSLAGYGTILVWSKYGLDLSVYSTSLQSVGMPTVIYPEVYFWDWITTWIAVTFMAVAACLYPALKAARKKPVEAMRM